MSNFNVLLVEDTIILAQMVMESLKQIPEITTTHSSNGFQAIEYLENNRPDLILLDLNILGKSGWQVMEFLKSKYGEGEIKVIVITAQSDSANKLVGKLQGIERYLVKPIPPREMLAIIREVLEIEPTE